LRGYRPEQAAASCLRLPGQAKPRYKGGSEDGPSGALRKKVFLVLFDISFRRALAASKIVQSIQHLDWSGGKQLSDHSRQHTHNSAAQSRQHPPPFPHKPWNATPFRPSEDTAFFRIRRQAPKHMLFAFELWSGTHSRRKQSHPRSTASRALSRPGGHGPLAEQRGEKQRRR